MWLFRSLFFIQHIQWSGLAQFISKKTKQTSIRICRSVYILAAKALLHLPHDWTRRKQGGLEVLTKVGMSIWLGHITVVAIRGSLPELHAFDTNFSLAGHINEIQSRQVSELHLL